MGGSGNKLVLAVRDIPPGGLRLEGETEAGAWGPAPDGAKFISPVHYSFLAQSAGGMVLIRGAVRAEIALACSRCLRPVIRPLRIGDFFAEQPILSPHDTIDLTPALRDYMFLALPGKPLCSSSCRGFCPGCGADLNSEKCRCRPEEGGDSPFAALGRLGKA